MTAVTTGPWDTREPNEREEQHERRHADALDFAIGELEADPDDISACKSVCFFMCRSPFKAVRAKALEALRKAGDRQAE